MADDEPRDSPPWRARWAPPSPPASDTPEDEAREDDAALAETLGAFSTLPLLDGVSEGGGAESAGEQVDEEEVPAKEDESRLARFTGWLRWAAAPLGFLLFLSALTAYGVLRDRDSSSENSSPAPAAATMGAPSTTSVRTTSPTMPTTSLVVVPTTAVSEFARVTTTLLSPRAGSSPTSTAASPSRARSSPAPTTATTAAAAETTTPPVRYFGPACGHAPGQAVPITIDGRRERAVVADANGCLSFTYYGPACGYSPGDQVELVINGRPELPVTAGPDGCVTAIRG